MAEVEIPMAAATEVVVRAMVVMQSKMLQAASMEKAALDKLREDLRLTEIKAKAGER